jgi:KDPG and KHG aldolase
MTLDEALAHCPLIAILRGVRPDEVVDHASALFDAGIRAIEVPLNSPDPLASVARLASLFRDSCLCGAGTVLSAAEVEAVAAAGGRLIVSPNASPAVIGSAVGLGLAPLPGVATATSEAVPGPDLRPGPPAPAARSAAAGGGRGRGRRRRRGRPCAMVGGGREGFRPGLGTLPARPERRGDRRQGRRGRDGRKRLGLTAFSAAPIGATIAATSSRRPT